MRMWHHPEGRYKEQKSSGDSGRRRGFLFGFVSFDEEPPQGAPRMPPVIRCFLSSR